MNFQRIIHSSPPPPWMWRWTFIRWRWTFIWWRWKFIYFWWKFPSVLVLPFIRNRWKFISTRWKFISTWWKFISTSKVEVEMSVPSPNIIFIQYYIFKFNSNIILIYIKCFVQIDINCFFDHLLYRNILPD